MMTSLREATGSLHRDIENKMYGDKIMNGSLTVLELNHLLKVNYLFFKDLESRKNVVLAPVNELIPFRSNDALHDLTENNTRVDVEFTSQLENMENPAYAFGVVYVALGSSLGGKMIGKKLEKSERHNHSSYTFFSNSGVGDKWKIFIKLAEQTEFCKETASKGAVDAFNYFSYLIERTA